MSPDRVWYLLNADRRYHLFFARDLQKFLREQVVIVARDELGDIAYDGEYIELALRDGLVRQVHIMQVKAE